MEDVQGLRVFSSVAQNLSFTRAAEELFLTQSAVSHQISRLEKELGVSLFNRLGRSIELTPAGRALQSHALRVFAALHEAAAATKQADQPDAGSLRIGASATACQLIIPEALREFRECHPKYALSILPGDSPQVTDRLLDGSIDLGILIRYDRVTKLDFHALFDDQLGLVVSPMHRLSTIKKLRKQDLAGEKFVLYSRTSVTWRIVEQNFAKLGIPIRDSIELGSIEAIKELVKLGLGVAVLAAWVCQREIDEGSLTWLPIPGRTLSRHWAIASPAGRRLSQAQQTFVHLCQDVAKRFG
jgi:LysR family transcriptional regulator, low CO2-responsive transcriptional regulator